ncbi:Eco57I restriction-modification methylase domain-containing protein [Streptomyces jumonjinensis]|uniref:Eco57I restriction-modification methylase domain-containing protein n=1 Tax=Streptomyces jumonjinensis TaxID=1945 RepID=UPI0037978828
MAALPRERELSAVQTVGGLIPQDMLVRISEGKEVNGSAPADYHVIGSRSVQEEAERHWGYLKSVWSELRRRLPVAPEAEAPADPTGVAIARWLEPLFGELGFGRLPALPAPGITADDGTKSFAVSHRWNHVPIHMTPWNTGLDKRPGGPGGLGTVPPHSLVQECLNRTSGHLWAVLTNGRRLRLLRDSSALATASYVEFDLEAIFDGELFSQFVLLYRMLQVSRFDIADGATLSSCWLERWRTEAIESGTRALDQHRDGVQRAVTVLGTGFLRHPANAALRQSLDTEAFHGALLRLTYRLIFLFVAEDRGALHPPDTDDRTRQRYARYFSSARLRHQATRRRGTAHTDLFQALRLVLDALGDDDGRPELGLPGLGGLFDDTEADRPLHGLALANEHLLEAVRSLSRVRDTRSGRWRTVDYLHLGSEELGSIYESLLELVPKHNGTDGTFELVNRLGNNRKKTGSYFTPGSLIETLLDSTLDPVITDAQKRGAARAAASGQADPTAATLDELQALTVCDPACGSGHFLVASARRIAKQVAAVRERNPEPTPDAIRRALHEVIARSVYGVDLNPMAVDLAKISLWMEAMEPGRPMSFLDAHIKHGNALIGATPKLLRGGIPNKAFKAVEGDDAKHAASLAKRNNEHLKGQGEFSILDQEERVSNASFARGLRHIIAAPSGHLRQVRDQAAAYRRWREVTAYTEALHHADTWCAAFFWHKAKDAPPPVTHEVFRSEEATQATHDEIDRLRREYRFFHWHLEFPQIFRVPEPGDEDAEVDPETGWAGGFDCVVGNPPWGKVDFEDLKYFSVVEPSIAEVAGVARRERIKEWAEENPEAGRRYAHERRRVKSAFLFFSGSGAFPLCAQGLTLKGGTALQTDQLFTERLVSIVASEGRSGCIVPTALATGSGGQYLFGDLVRRGAIVSLCDFENRKPLFSGVHSSYKFCLLSIAGREIGEISAKFAFFLLDVVDLEDVERVFTLSPEEISLVNPNTGTLPIFRTRRDADLTVSIYQRIPVLWEEAKSAGNYWRIIFKADLFGMTHDSDLFRTSDVLEAGGWERDGNEFVRGEERMLPLYEGKMVHHFDHRWNSYHGTGNQDRRLLDVADKKSPSAVAYPRYWIADGGLINTVRKGQKKEIPGVRLRLEGINWERGWVCGRRDVCRNTDERTAIAAFLPRAAIAETYPLMFPGVSPALTAALIAAQSSLVFDFVSRQKTSNAHMKLYIWKQLPVPTPDSLTPHLPFLVPRVLELVYTAYDMTPLARDLGDSGPPFQWDEARRAQLRAELDAYFFRLYGIERPDVDYILETFQTGTGGLKNNEIAKYGTYRTKDLVLAEYDRMAPAGAGLETPLRDGENYLSPLNPPPGDGPRHPAQREEGPV